MKAITRKNNLYFKRFHSLLKILMPVTIGLSMLLLTGCKENFVGMLNPKGIIAYQERKLFFDTLALMLIVVLPVIIMSITFIYQYQAKRRNADYAPNWGHSYFLESIWWGIPCVIIFILAVMTWKQTHELDPYRPIPGYGDKPMVIQAIALPWKWLFIYPEQGVATVNYLEIPVGRDVEYSFTTDNVPMSAFFVAQLGSQIYTMAGMRTKLHLVANETGVYEGMNTQYNGEGFSDMRFVVNVVTPDEMTRWVNDMKKSPLELNDKSYLGLLIPTVNEAPKLYGKVTGDIFNSVINTYMTSFGTTHPRANVANYSTSGNVQREI